MRKNVLVQSLSFLFWMTILTGILYPALVTIAAQLAFRDRANGSLLVLDGQVRGSRLLAQDFSGGAWFLARPSATKWETLPSGASNLAATNPALATEEAANAAAWDVASGPMETPGIIGGTASASSIPPDMATSSGSGLDPDISLASALGQLDRVATERSFDAASKAALEGRIRAMAAASVTLLGPERVNVVELNASLARAPSPVDVPSRVEAPSPGDAPSPPKALLPQPPTAGTGK